ncbi:uncharacterized protein METZ01_LOCUS197899, partial [marine metagenome]
MILLSNNSISPDKDFILVICVDILSEHKEVILSAKQIPREASFSISFKAQD